MTWYRQRARSTNKFWKQGVHHHTSSSLRTISTVGVFGIALLILFLSSLVTSEGVIGMQGVNGWYGEYGTAVPGVRALSGDRGPFRSKTVCLVVWVTTDGELRAGSYARRGRELPVRTADGALGLEKEAPGLGDNGREGILLPACLGETGMLMRGTCECSDAAD